MSAFLGPRMRNARLEKKPLMRDLLVTRSTPLGGGSAALAPARRRLFSGDGVLISERGLSGSCRRFLGAIRAFVVADASGRRAIRPKRRAPVVVVVIFVVVVGFVEVTVSPARGFILVVSAREAEKNVLDII